MDCKLRNHPEANLDRGKAWEESDTGKLYQKAGKDKLRFGELLNGEKWLEAPPPPIQSQKDSHQRRKSYGESIHVLHSSKHITTLPSNKHANTLHSSTHVNTLPSSTIYTSNATNNITLEFLADTGASQGNYISEEAAK